MTLQDRIIEVRKSTGLNKSQFGKLVGVSHAAVTLWESGGTKTIKHEILSRIAQKTGYSPEWVNLGRGNKFLADSAKQISNKRSIPLITWDEVNRMCRDSHAGVEDGAPQRWRTVEVFVETHPGMYAVQVDGNSMNNPVGTPSFPDGATLVVDPSLRPDHGMFVIARLGNGKATFKRLTYDGTEQYLIPLNPQYSPIHVQDQLRICGVVVAMQLNLTESFYSAVSQ